MMAAGIALQWLSASHPQSGHLCCTASSSDATAIARIRQQAAEDWRLFLGHRATEMKSGAHLVITALCLFPGHSTLHHLLDLLSRSVQPYPQDGTPALGSEY